MNKASAFLILIFTLIFGHFNFSNFKNKENEVIEEKPVKNELLSSLEKERIISPNDKDNDGIDDYSDIYLSAISQIGVVTKYDTSYYSNGFPPEDSGSCTDVIWRALDEAGYDFKEMLDEDIRKFPNLYPSSSELDSNINFRRVKIVKTFLERNVLSLTKQIVPRDFENLKNWQAGDIVTYDQIPGGLWHIAIISEKRREDGVPLLVHNYGRGVKEDDYILDWPAEISGHFRFELKD